MQNYDQVVRQMEAFGVKFKKHDLPLQIPTPKRKTCGLQGKWWYWLQLFRRRDGSEYVVGRFGWYRHGGSFQKVEVDWAPLTDAEQERLRAERAAAAELAKAEKQRAAALAAMNAAQLWRHASREGRSAYLTRKGVQGEACRYLPDGSLVIPLMRYDLPRDQALQACQTIWPDGTKRFTKGFAKTGCALRLGPVDPLTRLVLVAEGYATALSIRLALARRLPVYVALDAYNLAAVVPMLRQLHPQAWLLICADDDWLSEDHQGKNPGRTAAMKVAKATERCDIITPQFVRSLRQPKDTDFNDLHLRQGLSAVERQLTTAVGAIQQRMARGR